MFLNHILLGFLGIAFGGAVAAGTFAFVIVIGVVPRMIGKCNRAAGTLCFEQAIILGGIPVSYTHLDVYKRQSINRIFCDDLLTEKVKQILCEKGG